MNEINTIHLWGIRIDEPIVTLTDLLVSVLCFIYAYKITNQGKVKKYFFTSKSIFSQWDWPLCWVEL